MTAAERDKIVEIFSKRIRSQNFLRLQQIPQVFEEENLDKNLYAQIGPKRWVIENFPEFQVDAGREVVVFATSPAPKAADTAAAPSGLRLNKAQRKALVDHFQDEIDRTGLCWCATVASFMRNNGFPEWRQLVRPGESLPAWLAREFPEFRHDMKNGASAIFSMSAGDGKGQNLRPLDTPLRSISFKFAYLPQTAEMTGQFQQLVGNTTIGYKTWHSICVQKIGNYLLGLNNELLDDSGAQEPRMAFPLGIKTKKDQNIYVVLIPNSNDGAHQPWMMGGFCYPGQRDPAGYGKWLCQTFGIPSEDQNPVRAAYTQVHQQTQELETLRSSLLDSLDAISAALEQGQALPQDTIRQMADYQRGWNILRQSIDSVMLSIPTGGENLTDIRNALDSKVAVVSQLDKAADAFGELVKGAWNYLSSSWLCDESRAPEGIERDLGAWIDLMEREERESDMADSYRQLLQPFQALLELTRPRSKVDPTVSQAMECANSHFGMNLTPQVIRASFVKVMEDTPDAFSFLKYVDVVEDLLDHAEVLIMDKYEMSSVSSKTAESFSMSSADLLREMSSTSGNISAILSKFAGPDPLELAIMLGQIGTARNLLSNSASLEKLGLDEKDAQTLLSDLEQLDSFSGETSLYSAGVRLLQTVNTRHGQAERCFMIGLALRDIRCADYLFQIYQAANKSEELIALYSAFGSQVSEEVRGKLVTRLLLSDNIDAAQAIQEDVLNFLTPELMERATTQDGFLPDETVGLLRNIYDRLDIPFVRYVIFLSKELQNYILYPENIESLQAAGIEKTTEQLVSLTKSGHYSKGRGPLEVAQRVYDFMGTWAGLAETFAALTSEDTAVNAFRLRIARDKKDEAMMFSLLENDSALQAEYWKDYGLLLFSRGDYNTFLTHISSQAEAAEEFSLQIAIAAVREGIWDGELPSMPKEEELADCTQLLGTLAHALLDTGHMEQLYELQLGLFDQMLALYDSEILQRFITVDGDMGQESLSGLQHLALEAGYTGLAVYCGNVLNVEPERVAEQSSQYFSSLMQEARGQNTAEQLSAIQRIQIIFGEQYADLQEELFGIRFCAMLENLEKPEDGSALVDMLQEELSETALRGLLDTLKNSPVANRLMLSPALCEKLAWVCREKGLEIDCLRFFHLHSRGQDGAFGRFLCRLYISVLNETRFPQELLVEAESFALEQIQTSQDPTAAMCVYLIETLRGRLPFQGFTLCWLQRRSNETGDLGIEDWLQNEISQLPPDTPLTELNAFARVLEDSTNNVDVYEYLIFCSFFGLLTDEEKDSALQMTRAYATETESIPLLHMLYQDFKSAENWGMCCRLSFQDRPQIYARLLYYAAQARAQAPKSAGDRSESCVTWARCVDYCRKNDQSAILLQSLLSWAQEILDKNGAEFSWTVTKSFFSTIEDLCQERDCLQDWPADQAESLVKVMCDIFGRINTSAAGDSNHRTFRIINELAVLTCQEDVVLNCPNTQESLLGQNRKLGFVMALLLLRAGQPQKAWMLLQTLAKLRDGMAYPVLLADLASKSIQELDEWKQTPVAESLIEAILPDGNLPNGLSIRALIMKHILNNSCDVGISAVEELLRNNEHDGLLHVALFILCKQDYKNHIPQIYRALTGVYHNYTLNEQGMECSWYYTRSRGEIFRLLVITRAVMKHQGLPIPEQDQDINDFLGSASLISEAGRRDKNGFILRYTDLFNEVTGKFAGYDEAGTGLWVEAFMGAVTGNWTPFLLHAYEQKLVSRSYFECTNYSSWGLLRCALQVMKNCPTEERSEFLEWIQANVDVGKETFKNLYAIKRIASALKTSCNLDVVSEQLLKLPLEEHFICLGDLKDISSRKLGSCYQWLREQMEKVPLSITESDFRIFAELTQDVLKAQVLFGDADKLFNQGKDSLAKIYYNVLYNRRGTKSGTVRQEWSLYPEKDKKLTEEDKNKYRTLYQSRSCICAVFSGDQAEIEKLKQGDWCNYYNMLVTMLSSKRANEIYRLARYFDGKGRQLAVDILKLISPDVEDSTKQEIYESYCKLNDAAEGLALLLCQKGPDGKYLFLHDGNVGNSMRQNYTRIASSSHCFLTLSVPPKPSAFAQTEEAPELVGQDWFNDEKENPNTTLISGDPASMIPRFALDIQGRLSGQELRPLNELESIYNECSLFDYKRRAEISGQIYCRVSMDEQSSTLAVSEALISYGLDYCAYHMSNDSQSNLSLAFQAERELALYCKAAPSDAEHYRSFISKIPIALQRMLKNSPSVDALVQDYQLDTQGYEALVGFAERELPFFSRMFSVIRGLAQAYSNINGPKLQNVENYMSAYTAALKQLEGLTVLREFGEEWLSVRRSLMTKLYDALNSLDQRPDLSVTVLNHRMQGMRSDAIFGELQNTGRERAANIELQATFFDGENTWLGRKCGYPSLLPGEKVAFALSYDIEREDAQTLEYTLNITYYHNQGQMSSNPEKGQLTIVPQGPLAFSTDRYATDHPVWFDIDENGTVVGKDFFGREQQMEAMREAVAGKSFPDFSNVLVRGIRRSGKTSLLHYLETYIGAVCQDTIAVKVDCQGIKEQPVQTAFITKVLNGLERKLPAAAKTEAWKRLTEKWALPTGEADRSPDMLQDFYLDLEVAMNAPSSTQDSEQSANNPRKGVLLIIDEFDVMLQRMQSSQQDYVLLQGLRAITQSSDCRRAVHFVLCGSNNLISYTREGERYYQTFQDFKPHIEVDELPQKDMEEMLLSPYRDDPEVILPKETLEWVRRYTGGLVWYTKLLGNQMLKVAKENRRSVVYPSDVCKAFSSICEGGYCIQFYEGCGDMEHDVLEALASLSLRYQSYVTLDKLKEQLANMRGATTEQPASADAAGYKLSGLLRKPHMDGQIAQSLAKLIALKLVQKDSTGQDRFCFKREIYRRFFRTQITRVDKGETLPDQMEAMNISKKKSSVTDDF